MTPRRISPSDAASLVQPGDALYVTGCLLPPAAFVDALQADPARSAGVRITSTIAPGFPNPFDFDKLHPTAVLTGPLMLSAFTSAQRQGRYRALPVTFSGFLCHLATQRFDLGVVQVCPPDANGRYSLGPSVEFWPAAMQRCRRVLAVVNPLLRPLPYAVSLEPGRVDAVCEAAAPIPEYLTDTDDATEAIGRFVAGLIDDGCTLQTGLGKVPAAIARSLRGHRGLKIHTGMVSDGLMDLAAAGALADGELHRMAVVAGSGALYDWLPQAQDLRIVGCDETHAPAGLARLERFVTVNSALEVDLFGQCNLEFQAGRAVSSAGAAPDFARAARTSPGGISIVALGATYAGGSRSRIVSALASGTVASLSRLEVDAVVTEFGVADLRQASVHERAAALIAVAAPPFREDLERAWFERARSL